MNGGIQPAQGAVPGHHVGDHRNAGTAEALRVVGNDDCPIDYAAQPRQLTVQNGRAAGLQNQPGFVQPPQAPRMAAREDGSRPHRKRVAGGRISEE